MKSILYPKEVKAEVDHTLVRTIAQIVWNDMFGNYTKVCMIQGALLMAGDFKAECDEENKDE